MSMQELGRDPGFRVQGTRLRFRVQGADCRFAFWCSGLEVGERAGLFGASEGDEVFELVRRVVDLGISLIRNNPLLGPYSRTMSRAIWRP